MMADFVVPPPRHSAVMERLRRRIELFRRHHNSCENRYQNTAMERLELERQQTFALHQRCLQTKAKRSSKHRQPQPNSDQALQRGHTTGGSNAEQGDGATPGDQNRNSTLIALQETVRRKQESSVSPLGRDQVNGYSDGYPPSKKACLDNGISTLPPRSPLDSKQGLGVDALLPNGNHGTNRKPGGLVGGASEQEFRLKEMKQEPVDDVLPCMLPGGGPGSNLFPDLNLNEQEWTELMEELNRSVAYEDIQDILNDGFDDRKDPPELGSGSAGGGISGPSSQGLLPPDLACVKSEFSPVSAAFEQDSRTASPHVRPTSSGPPVHTTNSPATATSSKASSPGLPQPLSQPPPPSRQPLSQPPPPSRQLPPQPHLLPPGPVSKDLSPAQQLQQLAAQQQRAQQIQNQFQHQQAQKQQQQQQQQLQSSKFHPAGPHPHTPSWPATTNPSQTPLGPAYGLEKPSSPSLYPQDFPSNPKQLMMPGQPNKGSPKAGAGGAGGYLQPNMLGHPTPGAPLSHPGSAGGQAPSSMLNYNNTKPLSHYEAGASGPPRGPPNTQSQNKATLLSLLRQQQQMKQKASLAFCPHAQDQASYPAAPQGPGPGSSMPQPPGGSIMQPNHGNPAFLSNPAAVLKQQHHQQQQQQQQQQLQFLLSQRQQQQMMAEQEKQRQQQEQQLQRHLTRPPPQYHDQQTQPPAQNPFQQTQVSQFPGSSQPMGNVGSLGGPAPGTQRMFPQTQSMLGMNMGQGGGPAPGPAPPASSQADLSLPACGGGGGGGMDVQQVLYNSMGLLPGHPSQQSALQRQAGGGMGPPYRHSRLPQQPQHLKNQPSAALLKQPPLARVPGSLGAMPSPMPSPMPNTLQSVQSQVWPQHQAMPAQTPSTNGSLPPNAFSTPSSFHLQQQTRMPKMPTAGAPFGANTNGRTMGGMTPGQQMMQSGIAPRPGPNPQGLGLGPPVQSQQQNQQQQVVQNQGVLPDLGVFGPGNQAGNRTGLQCSQGYQVTRTVGQQPQQQQQQLSFGYSPRSGFPGDGDLDTLLKGQSTQEWMDDLDELLASHQ
ncbi:mastermind-like protein 1 isoform X2 [Osmerus eperlanus]|uniref:mastermind-like protein 1 isoform X2 n=1 Tax=Osmerus eperlanus TaxID=29151 RepID=UPI002E138648